MLLLHVQFDPAMQLLSCAPLPAFTDVAIRDSGVRPDLHVVITDEYS